MGDQTRVSSHRQPIMSFFTQAGSKPTMVFRLSPGKHSRAGKARYDSHCLCMIHNVTYTSDGRAAVPGHNEYYHNITAH